MTDSQCSTAPPSPPRFIDSPAVPCPICNDEKTRSVHFPAHPQPFPGSVPWEAHDKCYCRTCGNLWAERFKDLSLAQYGREYVKANTDAQRVPNERMSASPRLLDKLLAWTDGRRFLDCGIGYNTPYVEQMRALGIDLWGCDISTAVPYDQHIVRLPDDLAKLGEESFDAVFSQDVVEHFADPVCDYSRLRSLIRPGGLVLSSTPVLEKIWDGCEPVSPHIWLWSPWHASICSSRSMAMLAAKAGLEFVATVPVPTETRWAFLLRKPGGTRPIDIRHEGSPETRALRRKLQSRLPTNCPTSGPFEGNGSR